MNSECQPDCQLPTGDSRLLPGTQHPVPSTQHRAPCPHCSGSGWKPVLVDGVERFVVCACRVRARAMEAKKHPGGFVPVGEGIPRLIAELNPIARMVRGIVLEHRGESNPVTIAEIAAKLWPDRIPNSLSRIPANEERAIKQGVCDLRTLGKMLIGSSRDPQRPGYFLIETQDELNRQRTHCLRHIRAWLRSLKSFDPDGTAARELYGQLRAEFQSADYADSAEVKT